jgi:hypothetical protein
MRSQYLRVPCPRAGPSGPGGSVLGTLVAAGGRLLLAAAIQAVRERGGAHVFCDTDSLFVAASRSGGHLECPGAPGGVVRLLSFQEVEEIRALFEPLNPFDRQVIPGSILEVEEDEFEAEDGSRLPVHAFSIAAKRYALFVWGPDGRPHVIGTDEDRRRSKHGLGHLLSPLEEKEPRSAFYDRWWEHLLCRELEVEDPQPEWFGLPAIGQLTVTSSQEERNFRAYNRDRQYQERVQPWNFLLMAQAHPVEVAHRGIRCLVAPFDRDAARAARASDWFDRLDPDSPAYGIRTGSPEVVEDGVVAVQSYGEYFEAYRLHPEAKALGPHGNPCRIWTRGVLGPRSVRATRHVRIGKESNRLSDDDLVLAVEDLAIEYPEPRLCVECGVPLEGRQRMWHSDACRKRSERRGSAAAGARGRLPIRYG